MHPALAPHPVVPAATPGPPEEVVTVRGLAKAYGGRAVVDGLDLSVAAGEVVGLIGANGAGKTTTVECLQGLRRADAGRIRVLGLDPVTDADTLRPMIGSQLQDSGLPDRLRVHEALWLFGGPDAGDGEELLERFGLGVRRRLAFATMSGGERQRLFLVLALLNRPRLVILDELTQGLDPVARREVWAAVARLRDGGTTVLLVTHELEEAEVLCDRVARGAHAAGAGGAGPDRHRAELPRDRGPAGAGRGHGQDPRRSPVRRARPAGPPCGTALRRWSSPSTTAWCPPASGVECWSAPARVGPRRPASAALSGRTAPRTGSAAGWAR